VPEFDTGDTAWVLTSAALVLFMTPGLALFYGGMVRVKNVLAMLMQNFFAMGIVTILWVLLGYSLAFGDAGNGGFIGNLDYVGLKDLTNGVSGTIPTLAFVDVPVDIRRDHARADYGCDRRPDALAGMGVVHRTLVGVCLSPGRALGLRRRLAR
jgi:hypothetical protein